jgi:hypothetical protein
MSFLDVPFDMQLIVRVVFIVLIFAPLPLLILAAPVIYFREQARQQNIMNKIRTNYANIKEIRFEQLRNIFPELHPREIDEIFNKIHKLNSEYSVQ